ncbi:MAG: DUF2953 domain-containing protein [Oscillospiraceae bacterium]|jgi:hypothetical protein|nr:DUF2953 domain-containing protein [Oscillospiraceae bacterium]
MKGLIITLLILLFLFALTLFPIEAMIKFDKTFTLDIRYIFIRLRIIPGKPGKEGEKKPKPEKEKPKEEKPKQKKTWDEIVDLVHFGLDAVKFFWPPLKKFFTVLFKALEIYNTDIFLRISGEAPDRTGDKYGKTCAGVYAAYGILSNILNINKIKIDIQPDFMINENVFRIRTTVQICALDIFRLVFILLIPGIRFLFIYGKFNKEQKKKAEEAQGRDLKAA